MCVYVYICVFRAHCLGLALSGSPLWQTDSPSPGSHYLSGALPVGVAL